MDDDDDAKAALAWTHTARFLTTASNLDELPTGELPEIAFVGRSNAGKSSAINALTQQRQLAFASRTPGRTQHVNLFELGPKRAPDALFADLPGYGFAAVPKDAKARWQRVMGDYLQVRRNLAGIVALVDSRHGVTPIDAQLLAFVAPRLASGVVRLVVLLTKIDKLNRSERATALKRAEAALADVVGGTAGPGADVSLTAFSATARTGVADTALLLRGWTLPVAA